MGVGRRSADRRIARYIDKTRYTLYSQTMMTLLGALALGGILKRSSKPETNDDNSGEETDGKEGREE